MDPNEVRLRLASAQPTSVSSAQSVDSPNVHITGNPPHGGDMDPNEVRLRLARMQQTSRSSPPAANNAQPNDSVASHGGVRMWQAGIQPAHYGSSPHSTNLPSSLPSGYHSTYQTSQSPQSTDSRQYFHAQNGQNPSYPSQPQQLPQQSHAGLSNQVRDRQFCYMN